VLLDELVLLELEELDPLLLVPELEPAAHEARIMVNKMVMMRANFFIFIVEASPFICNPFCEFIHTFYTIIIAL
jgi:hypothetical protein